MSRPARKRTRARFGLTATHTGAHGVSHLVSSLADILEVLLRAGFVPSTPGTPELCSSAYTLQVALCAQSAIRNLSNAYRVGDHIVLACHPQCRSAQVAQSCCGGSALRTPPHGLAGDLGSSVRGRTRAGGCRFRMGGKPRPQPLPTSAPPARVPRGTRAARAVAVTVHGIDRIGRGRGVNSENSHRSSSKPLPAARVVESNRERRTRER